MNVLLMLILLVSALAAVLAGMAVFSNSRPPDNRVNQVINDLDEIRGLVNQLQKSVMALERKVEKDQKDFKAELKDILEQVATRIDRRLTELAGG